MFRDPDNALLPNWLEIPIGYNGRASSVVVSGTALRRPNGQTKLPNEARPTFGPCRKLDYELEMGFIVGKPSVLGEPVSTADAPAHMFGMVIPQRLERARHPAVGIRAARAVQQQVVRDVDLAMGGDDGGARAIPP